MYRKSWLTLLCGIAFLIPTSEQYINLTLRRTRKFIPPPPPPVVQGRVDGTPPRSFSYVAVFWNHFPWSGKPSIFLTRSGIWFWGGGVAGGVDVTNNVRHLGFYQESEIRLKPREMIIFFVLYTWLYMKYNTCISTLHDFSHKIYFYCWKKLKKHVFSPKIGVTTCYLRRHIL